MLQGEGYLTHADIVDMSEEDLACEFEEFTRLNDRRAEAARSRS